MNMETVIETGRSSYTMVDLLEKMGIVVDLSLEAYDKLFLKGGVKVLPKGKTGGISTTGQRGRGSVRPSKEHSPEPMR
jgi:hypothetical protein